MYRIVEKTELNQISLTGMRALVLVGLLIQAPRSLEEIKEAFINYNIMERSHSDDIIRIDLNTLRAMGCEISRATARTNYKYVLTKHPFELNINDGDIGILSKAYKKIKGKCNIQLLLDYDNLFKKIAEFTSNKEIKEKLYGISILKDFSIELIQVLLEDCRRKNRLKILYQKTTDDEESIKDIIVQKLVFNNDKIYLQGFNLEKQAPIILHIKRIKDIIFRIAGDNQINFQTTKVKFHLKSFGVLELNEDENIIKSDENGYIIEGDYHNDFIAIQRILSFGSDCTVLEPENFKNKIIEKLKSIRREYND